AASGLAVLLDGPQGVSAEPGRLGVSLLRAPTWPDPSADQGLQRLRLALSPCSQGWRQQAVPQQAQRFREPLWLSPAAGGDAAGGWPALDLGSEALQIVGLQALEQPGTARLTLQNLSPQRQQLQWPEGWSARREFSAGTEAACASGGTGDLLLPWQLGSWLVWSSGSPVDQSS
ncbi:MAG: hypothetical protein RLZZ515_1899, partial [Cyanobacteriota bacterium]